MNISGSVGKDDVMIWSSPLTSAGNFPLTIFSLHTLRLRKRGYSRRQIDSKREHLNIATKFINGISNIMRLNEDPGQVRVDH